MMRRKPRRAAPALEHSDSAEAAGAAAVALLARRDFASTELAQRLREQGYTQQAIEAVLAELTERRLLDDTRYAEHFVAYRAERGQGPQRIRRELAESGLPPALIDVAVESGPDWRQRAREVRIRKFGLDLPDTWAAKARQAKFLQYRGFSNDHIRSALGPDFDLD